MPKSKKPRKKYRKEDHAQPAVITQEKIDKVHSLTTNYELITEMSLPQGCAKLDDIRCMRDLINLAITDLLLQNEYTVEQSEILNAPKSSTPFGTPWNSPPAVCIRRLKSARY